MGTGAYRRAAVGSCQHRGMQNPLGGPGHLQMCGTEGRATKTGQEEMLREVCPPPQGVSRVSLSFSRMNLSPNRACGL